MPTHGNDKSINMSTGLESSLNATNLNASWTTAVDTEVTTSQVVSMQVAERPVERYSVAVMGRSSVGKSAITLRYTSNRFVKDYDPTIEDTFLKETTICGSAASLSILDTAGQEHFGALRRNWMRNQSGFLFVFSLIDRQTFDELSQFYDELMDLYNDDPPPSVLVANKSDFDEAQWVVEKTEIQRLHASWKNCCKVIFTSAKSNQNVSDAFEQLCVAIRERAHEQRQRANEHREANARHREAANQAARRSDNASNEVMHSMDNSCRERCRLSRCTVQ